MVLGELPVFVVFINDLSQMLLFLHVILASVRVVTDMRDLFVFFLFVVQLSLLEIIFILIVDIVDNHVCMILSNLENDCILLIQILVVWIHQHELIVVCHVIVLINFLVFVDDVQFDLVFLNQKLWIFMDEERCQIVVPPLAGNIRIFQVSNVL